MRTVSALLIVVLVAGPASAANYYVSTTGSDSNSGSSLTSPFLTIQRAASVAQAGDNVYVRGGTYRETVTIANSGTASAPIAFQPYNNEPVTISGLDVLPSGGWSTYSGSTYQSTLSGGASQLFVGGQMMTEARSANSGYTNPLRRAYNTVDSASIQAAPANSTITSAGLGNPSNGTWTGAKMAVLGGVGMVTLGQSITSQTGNTLTFPWPSDYNDVHYNPTAGNPFYLYGSLAAVDAHKEYYYDASQSKLYFNSSVNPNAQTVEVRKRALGFDLGSNSYINVSGFRLMAANINVAGNHNQINNCQVLYPTPFNDDHPGFDTTPGLTISGQYNTLSNSEVAYSWGSGVTVSGSSNTVNNNLVHDVNWYGNDSAGIDISGTSNNSATNNTIYNAGRCGLLNRQASAATITHNEIARYGFLTKDLGATYCVSTDGGGTVIAYNKIHDCLDTTYTGAGVYLDDSSSNFTIHHNLITNVQYGIHLNHSIQNTNVSNNTLWGITGAAVDGGSTPKPTNVNTYNNLANEGTFVGSSTGTNLSTTTDQFVNSAAGNYTLKNGSAAVDAGTVIPGITDGYQGSAPDIGAFESGTTPWTAGASFKTWLAGNQAAAPLTASAVVTPFNVRTTTGSLIAGRTGSSSLTCTRSYLKFDVTGITTTIQSAILRIYENTPPALATGGVGVYAVTSSWDPGSVSYSQPVASTGTAFYDPSNLDLYTEVNVTSIVQGWINNPSSNYGFSLRSDAEGTGYSAKYFEGMYGVTAPQLVTTLAIPGDANLDGRVDVSDLAILAANYRKHVTGGWAQADFNDDGVVDVKDLAILAANYRYGVTSDVVPAYDGLDAEAIELLSLAGVTVAPEPCTLVMLAAALIGALAYAWWKRR